MYHYTKKLGTIPKCGDCKVKLHGVSVKRSYIIGNIDMLGIGNLIQAYIE